MAGCTTSRKGRLIRQSYGWRHVASVLGIWAILLQIGLGVVSGVAAGDTLKQRAEAGVDLRTLLSEICSPAGFLRSTSTDEAASADVGSKGPATGPVCPGCLFAQTGAVQPESASAGPIVRVLAVSVPPLDDRVRMAPPSTLLINPRGPPSIV